MAKSPNPTNFSMNERPREYEVIIKITGTTRRTVNAGSREEADEIAENIANKIAEGREGVDLDEVDDVDVYSCRKSPPMFRVTRDGRKMQVGRLAPGDLPREPDERGF